MDELVKLVTEKAGISESQAKKAVATVIDFLNDRLPAPIGAAGAGCRSGPHRCSQRSRRRPLVASFPA